MHTWPYEGTFYLIQPKKFLGTNIYKIGFTKETKPPYKRIKSYNKGTITYLTLKLRCANWFEWMIRVLFDEIFEVSHGREWYKGEHQKMTNEILKYYNKILAYDNSLKNENKHILEQYEKKCKEQPNVYNNHPLDTFLLFICKQIRNKYRTFGTSHQLEQIYVDFDYNNQWSTIYNRYKFKQNISFILGNLHFYNIQQYSEQLLC
tara:strand:- start:141 stop:755 length:615 start_codon:yes stop_codon:yes gene_type:complete